jgi:transcriptional antiterminator NusG
MEKKWYVIQTYVGFEHRVKAALERKIQSAGKNNLFGEVLVPTEKVNHLVKGKRQTVERRLFPGYVLAQIALSQESWSFLRSIPKVIDLLGQEPGVSSVLSEEEVRKIVETGMAAPRSRALFVVGENVRVVDGPFRDFTGTVESMNPSRSRVRVALSVFGRPTPVDLDFVQVEAA